MVDGLHFHTLCEQDADASPQEPRREPAAGLETRRMPWITAPEPITVATAAEIAAMTSPGMPPLSALAAGAAGLAAGAGAALAAGAAGACGLGSAGFLFFRSKSLPSRVMMRHRATSMAKTRVILVSTTVPSLASKASRARLGMGFPPFLMKHKTLFNKRAFICIIAQCELFW